MLGNLLPSSSHYVKADIIELKPVKDYPTGRISKFIFGGKSVVFGEAPKLKKYNFSASKYNTIIIGTPIWAGSYTPPIKTFLKDNDLSKKILPYMLAIGVVVQKDALIN